MNNNNVKEKKINISILTHFDSKRLNMINDYFL